MSDNKKSTEMPDMKARHSALWLFVMPASYYVFFTVIEITYTALIVWYAWNWRVAENESE